METLRTEITNFLYSNNIAFTHIVTESNEESYTRLNIAGLITEINKDGIDTEFNSYTPDQLSLFKSETLKRLGIEETTINEKNLAEDEFYKEFKQGMKVTKGASKAQLQLIERLADKTGSKIEVSTSKLATRFDVSEISEMIDSMKLGEKIRVY